MNGNVSSSRKGRASLFRRRVGRGDWWYGRTPGRKTTLQAGRGAEGVIGRPEQQRAGLRQSPAIAGPALTISRSWDTAGQSSLRCACRSKAGIELLAIWLSRPAWASFEHQQAAGAPRQNASSPVWSAAGEAR